MCFDIPGWCDLENKSKQIYVMGYNLKSLFVLIPLVKGVEKGGKTYQQSGGMW